jgi:membrane protease YdiL (CAAX protease family)
LRLPTAAAVWLNPILTAPFAEELLFRGMVFRWLRDRLGLWSGLALSSILFAVIHGPYWWLSGEKLGMELVCSLTFLVGLGLLMAGLFQATRSLWTPLVFHGINNLLSMSVVR